MFQQLKRLVKRLKIAKVMLTLSEEEYYEIRRAVEESIRRTQNSLHSADFSIPTIVVKRASHSAQVMSNTLRKLP